MIIHLFLCIGTCTKFTLSLQANLELGDFTKEQWKCEEENNTSINTLLVCNGKADCPKRSDEDVVLCRNWTCVATMWKCKDNMTCIDKQRVCDGSVVGDGDCLDFSDEDKDLCKTWECSEEMWRCRDGTKCIKVPK